MRKILLPLLLSLLPAAAAIAQDHDHAEQDDQPLYEGVWTVRFAGHRTARLEVRDWTGTWRETGAAKATPAACRGRKIPVTVQHSTEHALEFTVFGSSANKACPDTSYEFRPVDAKTLEADLEGGKATMKRVGR